MKRKDPTVVLEESDREELLVSEKRKYPEVFKWKLAAIIIAVLTVILLGVNIFLIVYLNDHQIRKTNYSFTTDLINMLKDTDITALQFTNMMNGLANSYQQLWFQKAKLIEQWKTGDSELNVNLIVNFFWEKVEDRLTIIQLTDNTDKWLVGAFTHVPFHIPTAWEDYVVDQNKNYFTFQIDDRQSSIVGGNSPTYLRMNGNQANLTNCKIVSLSKNNLYFLEAVDLVFESAGNQPTVTFGQINSQDCFSTNAVGGTLGDWLNTAVGPVDQGNFTVTNLWTYQLET